MSNGKLSARNTRWLVAAAIAALILGAILSRVIEPGVRVEKMMLTTNTPHAPNFPRDARSADGVLAVAGDQSLSQHQRDGYPRQSLHGHSFSEPDGSDLAASKRQPPCFRTATSQSPAEPAESAYSVGYTVE